MVGAAPASRRPGSAGRRRGANIGRTREIWPDARRVGVVRAARRQGARRRASRRSPASSPRTASTRAARRPRLERRSPTNTATDEELAAIEAAVGDVLRPPHDAGALRHRLRDQPDARARATPPARSTPAPSSPPATSSAPTSDADAVRDRPRSRSSTATVTPGRCQPTASTRHRRRGPRRRRRTGRLGGHEHPGVRVGRGGADRDPLLRRARRDRAARSSRRPGPTSCASTRSAPTTRTASRARRMYDGLNVGKRNVTLNLKHPEAVELVEAARRRVGRRGRGELRAAGDARLRPRLRRRSPSSSPTW